MPDVIYVLMTLLAFAALALLVGRLGGRLDDDAVGPADPTDPAGREPERAAAGR